PPGRTASAGPLNPAIATTASGLTTGDVYTSRSEPSSLASPPHDHSSSPVLGAYAFTTPGQVMTSSSRSFSFKSTGVLHEPIQPSFLAPDVPPASSPFPTSWPVFLSIATRKVRAPGPKLRITRSP